MSKSPLLSNTALILIATITLVGTTINIYLFINKPTVLSAVTDMSLMYSQKTEWERLLIDFPTFRDGWINYAIITKGLGEDDLSTGAINTATTLDPNSNEIIPHLEDYSSEDSLGSSSAGFSSADDSPSN